MADALTSADIAELNDLVQMGDAAGYYAYLAHKG